MVSAPGLGSRLAHDGGLASAPELTAAGHSECAGHTGNTGHSECAGHAGHTGHTGNTGHSETSGKGGFVLGLCEGEGEEEARCTSHGAGTQCSSCS